MNIIKKFFAYIRLEEAIRIAEKAHNENGQRYYVLPNGMSRKLIVTDRSNYRKLRHKGYYANDAKMDDVEKASFYYTAHRNGDGRLSADDINMKRMQYYHWLKSLRMRRGGKGRGNDKK